jgi:hydrogenase maturation protease
VGGVRAAPARGRRLVVGIGEASRRDDGCGPSVIRALRGTVPSEVELAVADPSGLLELWQGAELAIVVDAMRSGAPAGTVVRLDGDRLESAPPGRPTSSHGLSIPDAVGLGRALGRLPSRLVAYLIEVADVGPGAGLSPEVALAVGRAADRVRSELAGTVVEPAPKG